MSGSAAYPTVDLALARRLERCEGMANAASVDSRRVMQPDVGAGWTDIAGTYAMFDGPESPLTQTFGLGIFEPFLEREFEQVEEFFASRGAPTFHEVSSFAPRDTLGLLGARGYSPVEASVVLVRPTSSAVAAAPSAITVRRIGPDELPLWLRITVEGWTAESPEFGPFLENLGNVMGRARGVSHFLAELDGVPVAAGGLNIQSGTALLAGAATIPSARRRGAQNALLNARLAFAAEQGVDLAMVVTQPGSASQRNSERQGFRPVYTRAKWQRPR